MDLMTYGCFFIIKIYRSSICECEEKRKVLIPMRKTELKVFYNKKSLIYIFITVNF